MRLREIKGDGFSCWPPVWIGEFQRNSEEGVLRNVAQVPGTTLLKIDVRDGMAILEGIIIVDEQLLGPVYHRLKNSLGRPLKEVGDLEIVAQA